MSHIPRWLFPLVLLVLVSSPAVAQKPGKKKGAPPAQQAVAVGFTVQQRDLIQTYFAQHRRAVKRLPPGIAKNLARGKPLPPGIAKQQLPQELATRLPVREGFQVSIFGDRIVLLEAHGLVVDVLEGIFH